MSRTILWTMLAGLVLTAQAPPPDAEVETTSLLGRALVRPELDDDFRLRQEGLLAEARAALREDPADADALIWAGRRTAYLGRYREAVEIFGRGLALHGGDPRFLRHRGHRYITLRRFDDAVADLARAAELIAGTEPVVEPDGLPNARGAPTSTLHSNVWYHLGLAYYLQGDFEKALAAYRECLAVADNPDMLVATSHWLYMTLRRLGREAEAARVLEPIAPGLEVIENHDYLALLRLYRGETTKEALLEADGGVGAATLGYGVGNWFYYNGDVERALETFRRVVGGDAWAAFGFIAAEADLARAGP